MKNTNLTSPRRRRHEFPHRIRKSQGGYFMIELALSLAIGTILAATQVTQLNQAIDSAAAVGTGQYMTALQSGVNQYIMDQMPALAISNPIPGFANPLQPTVAELVAQGYLQAGFSNTSPLGLSFNNQLARFNCPGSNCTVTGYAYSTTPYKDASGAVRSDILVDAVRTIGADGGMSYTSSPTLLNGFGGAWGTTASPVANPAGNAAGIAAIRIGTNSGVAGLLSQFYKLDGSRVLTGAMNANNNDITNAKNITAQGTLTGGTINSVGALTAGTITTPGTLNAAAGRVIAWNQLGEGGVLQLQGANGQNMFVENLNGVLRIINSPWNAQLFTVDQGGNVSAIGTVSGGRLTANGTGLIGWANNTAYDVAGGRLAAGNAIYSYGSICAGNSSGDCSGSGGVVMSSNGNLVAAGNLTSTSSTVNGTQTVNGSQQVWGSQYVNNALIPGAIASNGGWCGGNQGSIGRDWANNLYICN